MAVAARLNVGQHSGAREGPGSGRRLVPEAETASSFSFGRGDLTRCSQVLLRFTAPVTDWP